MTQALMDKLNNQFGEKIENIFVTADHMVTIEVPVDALISVVRELHDNPAFDFKQLIDVCGVDYLEFGESEWRTEETTFSGFSRGRDEDQKEQIRTWDKPRFASVYHLLSLGRNDRLRIRVFLDDKQPTVASVCSIWSSANWFEREAFDLFGIIYDGHPDLRRLLTDYGFVGHPFRKDFPLIGEVELRYDAESERCIYEPVSIQPRVTVPKVIRDDNRYLHDEVTASVKKETAQKEK